VRGFAIDAGAMFSAADDQGRQRVAVLGAGVLPMLDIVDPQAILGEPIRISGRQYTVIGVLAAKGATGFGDNDDQILIPFKTGRFSLFGTDRINDIWTRVIAPESVAVAMGQIQAALRRSHRIQANRPDDFSVRNQADILNTLSEATQTFTTLLAGIAAVSLLVGGIGIMNIMLVSVTERTREIGIRKALGATRRNILMQFLVEAVVLCVAGGIVGIALGAGASNVLQQSFGWHTAIDPKALAVAFAFAAVVGVLFGVWPARRAAVLDPIEALRYE
jgi:putative ABC transport system permease protein